MRSRRLAVVLCLALPLSWCLAVSGCASFPAGKLPTRSYEDVAWSGPKTAASYHAVFKAEGVEIARRSETLRNEAETVFQKSEMFAGLGPETAQAPYHVGLVLENRGSAGAAITARVISLLTLTLLPTYVRDQYVLIASVKKDDRVLKRYRYEEDVDTWYQLFLIALTPTHHPGRMFRRTVDNMLLHFLHDVQQDKLFEPPAKKP